MGISSLKTTRSLLGCSKKARRKSIAIAVDQTVKAKNNADKFLFEPWYFWCAFKLIKSKECFASKIEL